MNVQETILALEDRKIAIALEVGEHAHCLIDSNCPVAIQLRKLISESGVSFAEILEGYNNISVENPFQIDPGGMIPALDGKILVRIADKDIELDITDYVQDRIKSELQYKLEQLQRGVNSLHRLGTNLYVQYRDKIRELSRIRTLPQFQAPIPDLIKYEMMITSEAGRYAFLFKDIYNPVTIVDNGITYRISAQHIEQIKREVCLKISATPEGRVYEVLLLGTDGNELNHYHGRRGFNCWGSMRFSLPSPYGVADLFNIKHQCMGALRTINYNSILVSQPSNMPPVNEVREQATRLGVEGSIEQPLNIDQSARPAWRAPAGATPTPAGWGRRGG